MNTHNTNLKYKLMTTVVVTNYTNRTPSKHFMEKCICYRLHKPDTLYAFQMEMSKLNLSNMCFTTAGDWDCVAAEERLPALHYSVDFIFLSFGIMVFIVEV